MDIIVSEDLEGAIKGAKIDYSNSLFKKGFEVVPTFS
jgi:Fe-S cluster assembly iron-binding protein IscA